MATWKITSISAIAQQKNGLESVVSKVCWMASDTDGKYSAQLGGETKISTKLHTYIPYSQLTEEIVLQWCFDEGLDKAAVEANLAKQISYQANPPVVALPLPWKS